MQEFRSPDATHIEHKFLALEHPIWVSFWRIIAAAENLGRTNKFVSTPKLQDKRSTSENMNYNLFVFEHYQIMSLSQMVVISPFSNEHKLEHLNFYLFFNQDNSELLCQSFSDKTNNFFCRSFGGDIFSNHLLWSIFN